MKKLDFLLGGVQLDNKLNLAHGSNSAGLISVDNDDGKGCAVLVIPTDEEAMICHECEMLAKKEEHICL